MSVDLLDQVEANLGTSKVGIQEFAEGLDYCGKKLYPRQLVLLKLFFLEELTGPEEDILSYWIAGGKGGSEVSISPNIRERVQYLRDVGYEHFREVDLVGGRRSSKGFITGITGAKIMWDTLSLQDPGRHFGIDPEKDIYFSCVAGSETQAKEYQYADLVSTVESCKAFEPFLQKSLELEFRVATAEDLRKITQSKARGSKIQRDIAKLRGKALAANAGTLRGSATMFVAFDEMAHMLAGEAKSSASQVYNAAMPSLDQFGASAMAFCNSSPYSKVGMFYERYNFAMKEFDPNLGIGHEDNGSPFIMAFQYPSWALFEGYRKSRHKFKKAITVSADWDPEEKDSKGRYVHSQEDQLNIIRAKTEESDNPETYKVERRGKFAEVSDSYLNPDMVDRIFMGVPDGIDPTGNLLLKQIDTNNGATISNLYQYRAHLDPSSTTAGFGFAMGHMEMFEDAYGRNQEHVVFDIAKRWSPTDFPGGTIDWQTVIDEVIIYIDLFRPYEVSMDQFQSHDPIQRLDQMMREKGIYGTIVREKFATNEENWKMAETFKTAINHGLVHAPNDTPDLALLSQELKFLQQKNTGGRYPRVDKQDVGPVRTKDISDSCMVVTQSLIGNVIAQQMRDRITNSPVVMGAAGGFRIGGNQQPSLAELHPNLAGYYSSGKRKGEQSVPGYSHTPTRGAVGGGRRGMNRGSGRSS